MSEKKGFTLRTLLKHSGIYSLVPLLQRAASILMIPALTAALKEDPGDYGALEMSDFLILLIPQFVGANLLGGLTRFYFEAKTEADKKRLLSSTFVALAGSAWILAGLAFLMLDPLSDWVYGQKAAPGSGARYQDLLVLTLLIIPFSMTSRMTIDYLVILQRPVMTTVLRLIKSLGVVAINLWFVLGLEWGAWGYLLGILIGEVVISSGFLVYLLSRIGLSFSWNLFRPMLVFSLPLLPMGLLQMGLHQLDRVLIKELIPAHLTPGPLGTEAGPAMVAVGIYGLGYKIGMLIHVAALGSFMQVWQPWLFGMKDSPERSTLMIRVGTYAMAALAAVYLPVAFFGKQIVEFLSAAESFEAAFRIAPWASISYLFYAAYAVSQAALLLGKRSMDLMWVSAAALVVNVVLNFLMIPTLGIQGAAFATLGSFFVMAVLGSLAAKRVSLLCFDPRKVIELAVFALIAVLIVRRIDEAQPSKALMDSLPAIAAKAALTLAFLGYLWRRTLDEDGRKALVDIVRQRLGRS